MSQYVPETVRPVSSQLTTAAEPTSAELTHASIGQWGAVIAGALGGFAVTLILATLGAAIGITAGAAAADEAGAGRGEEIAAGFGIGAAVWLVISAIVVGTVGGMLAARTSRPDRPYHAPTLGLLTWAGGVTLAAILAATGGMGLMSGLGGAAASAAALARNERSTPVMSRESGPMGRPEEATSSRTGAGREPQLTEAERAELRLKAENAAKAASMAAWVSLATMLISLGATILAAKGFRRRVLATATGVSTS